MPRNNPFGGTQWTDEHCDELKRLAAIGKSFRIIAAEINSKFGTAYTRNATIGKAGRMGLSKEAAPSVKYSDRPRKPKQASGSRVYRRTTHNSNAMRSEPTIKMERLRCVEIVPLHTSVIDVNGCRYPYGDGPFTFCDHPKMAGFSYCVPHFYLCRQEPKPRHDVAFVGRAA